MRAQHRPAPHRFPQLPAPSSVACLRLAIDPSIPDVLGLGFASPHTTRPQPPRTHRAQWTSAKRLEAWTMTRRVDAADVRGVHVARANLGSCQLCLFSGFCQPVVVNTSRDASASRQGVRLRIRADDLRAASECNISRAGRRACAQDIHLRYISQAPEFSCLQCSTSDSTRSRIAHSTPPRNNRSAQDAAPQS